MPISVHDVALGQHRIVAVMATVFDFMGLGIERKVFSLADIFNHIKSIKFIHVQISNIFINKAIVQQYRNVYIGGQQREQSSSKSLPPEVRWRV